MPPIRASIQGASPVSNRKLDRMVEFCAGPGSGGAVLIGSATLQCRDAELYWTMNRLNRMDAAYLLRAEEYAGKELLK